MKTRKTIRRTALTLSLILLFGAFSLTALAAEPTDVTAELRPHVVILVDGAEKDFFNVEGQEVHPLFFNDTHYLPVRAIGELMGRNVNWDQKNLTITLAGSRTTGTVTGKADTDAKTAAVKAQLRPDFTIVVDNTRRTFTDARGDVVHPLLLDGTTYLPIRAIGELMGKDVGWDDPTKTIELTTRESLVTDADSFDQSGSATGSASATAPAGVIGEEQARFIALEKANALVGGDLKKEDVTFHNTRLEWDDGRRIYDVEFYDAATEYDFEIDALTGTVLDFDFDVENFTRPDSSDDEQIGEDRAKAIALDHAGLAADDVSALVCRLDRDDGRMVYEISFRQGHWEYEYEIDALTGAIRECDRDWD
ncbi:MAG: PepSY domain-containing protein [Clostridia bacterium]|nr:PepSY domain-containing protein [Clostridia bacterium]